MLTVSHLLALADEFQRVAPKVGDTTLSFRMFGDSKKIAALRAGGDITTARFNAALRWFVENWPEGAVWPKNVPQPEIAA